MANQETNGIVGSDRQQQHPPTDEKFDTSSDKWVAEFVESTKHVLAATAAKDGTVTPEDIALAATDGRLSGHDHRTARTLASNFSFVMQLLGREPDKSLTKPVALTASEVEQVATKVAAEEQVERDATDMNMDADGIIKTYGQIGKGITKQEVTKALGSLNLYSWQRMPLTALRDHFDEVTHSGPGNRVTAEDLKNFHHKVFYDHPYPYPERELAWSLTRPQSQKPPAESAPKWLDDFGLKAKDVIAKYEKDGTVTRKILSDAITDGTADGPSENIIADLYKNFDGLAQLIGDAREKPFKLTASDFDKLDSAVIAHTAKEDEVTGLQWHSKDIIEKFAQPGIQTVTKPDIEKALKVLDALELSEYRAPLEKLRDHFDELQGQQSLLGVSAEDITKYSNSLRENQPAHNIKYELQHTLESFEKVKDEPVSTRLYSDQLSVLESIVPDAVVQGRTGDCYFEATVAAIALVEPEAIRDMIQNTLSGKHTVTFAGAKDKPITVSPPHELEQKLYNRPTKYGTWASVLEKAYGEYRLEFDPPKPGFLDEKGADWSNDTPQDAAGHGGDLESMMQFFTGSKPWKMTIPNNLRWFNKDPQGEVNQTKQQQLAEHLSQALAPGKPHQPVAAGTSLFQPGGDLFETADGFLKMHAYTIMNFEPDGNGGGDVTIRNPHDGQDTEGTVTVSLDKFMKNFSFVVVGNRI